jgi:Tfp pilus assembly protein PilN
VRPINLIPLEQRRGAARRPGAPSGIGVYVLVGALGAAVLCVLALVLTSNSINSKTEELAQVQADAQGHKQVADALRPYGQFADVQRARYQQITALAEERFDWHRALHQLSLAIPRNVYLLGVAGTESPDVEVADGGAGGAVGNLRDKVPAPAFAITGCTYSQHAVARMMARMRNLDDVTQVQLAKSARREDSDTGGGTAVSDNPQEQNQDIQDCVGSSRVTKFDMLVVFGGAESGAAAASGAAGVPSGSAAPIAAAQGAAQQGADASAAAGAGTGGAP